MVQTGQSLEFTHFVVATVEGIIFAAAREGKRIKNFIIDVKTGGTRQQVNSHFEELPRETAEYIRSKAALWYDRVPTFYTTRLNIGIGE